ncbi:ABC transporter permease [bacterium]|nr:ABC transporter permease [bacterium]
MIANLKNLFRHRVLIYTLVLRELKARYRGSVLGFLWSFLNPLLMMGVYALVFNYYLRFDMKGYTAYLCCGLLPWIWFSTGVLEGSRSIIVGSNLVNKALFPAEILPIVSVLSNLVNFLLSLPMLLIILRLYHITLTPYALLFVFSIVVQVIMMTAIVMFLSTMSVYFRDVEQILANLMSLMFFVCPIIYTVDGVEIMQKYPLLYKANPIALVMMSYQDIFFYGRLFHWKRLLLIGLGSLLLFMIGYAIFNRNKDNFPEEV